MLFFVFNLILLIQKINSFFLSLNNNHVYMECGRSIIIKNHYWFLSEFLHLLKTFDRNSSINSQQIPFDNLYLIFNHILIHCQHAHHSNEMNKKTQNLDQIYQWIKTQIKN
jgi:5'-3' exonuclease